MVWWSACSPERARARAWFSALLRRLQSTSYLTVAIIPPSTERPNRFAPALRQALRRHGPQPRRIRREVNSGGSNHPPGFDCLPEHLADHRRDLPVMGLHHGHDLGDALDDWAVVKIILVVVDYECAGQSRRKLKHHLTFVLGHVCLLTGTAEGPPRPRRSRHRLVGEEPVSRVHLAEKLIPFGAKVLNHIMVSAGQRFSLVAVSTCQHFNLFFANSEEFAHTGQFGLKPSGLQ